MIPTAMRHRAIRIIIIAVVFAMIGPFAGTYVSVFLHGIHPKITSEAALPLGFLIPDGTAEDEMESTDAGSSGVCMVALRESFIPEVVPPEAGGLVAPASFNIHCAPYLPRIFRPPIG